MRLISVVCSALLAGGATQALRAQAPVTQPPAVSASIFDPAQLPEFSGRVQQFTLTPRGEIDGLILSDGTEVKTPPRLSTALAFTVRPGDSVVIHGLRAAALPLIQAVSVTNRASGRTVADAEANPLPRRGPPGLRSGGPGSVAEVNGQIRMALHGPAGDVNGVLLSDGTVLRLPPDASESLGGVLAAGRTVVAEGEEFSSPIGRVLVVTRIGSSREAMAVVDMPPPPGPGSADRRLASPGAGVGPPPPGPPPPVRP
jgi:hypothetical protein